MSVKMECVIRHTKSSYVKLWNGTLGILKIIIAGLVTFALLAAAIYICAKYSDVILGAVAVGMSFFVWLWTPLHLFAMSSLCILYRGIVEVAWKWDRDSFYHRILEYDGDGRCTKDETVLIDTENVVSDGILLEILMYALFYVMPVCLVTGLSGAPLYHDASLSAVIFLACCVLILVFTPIACSIAKCRKEEDEIVPVVEDAQD